MIKKKKKYKNSTMNYKIEPLRSEEYNKWNEFVDSRQELSIFHTAEWKQILEDVFEYIPFYHVVKNQEGSIVGVSPAFICQTFTGKVLISLPFFEYGGPFILEEYKEAYKYLFKMYKELFEKKIVKKVKIRTPPNLMDYSEYGVAEVGFEKELEAWDFVLELEGKDYEKDIWQGYEKKSDIRTNIRKALRLGAKINKKNNWETLYNLIYEKDNKLGSPVFPQKYFELLDKLFKNKLHYTTSYLPKEEIHKDTQEPEKENYVTDETLNMNAVGSMVSIAYHGIMLMHQLGSDEKYLNKCSTMILFNEMIKDAAAKGIKEVDFGRSKPESQHAHLKTQFLTKKRDVYAYYYPHAENHYKYLWVEKVFAKMPWLINKTPLGEFIIKRNP